MTSPVRLARVASTVATSDSGEYANIKTSEKLVASLENLQFEITCDVKPLETSLKCEDRIWFLVQQVKQIGETAFWGNNCLLDCSRRHGWRLNIIAQPKSVGDEVFGFVVFKIDADQRVLHIQYIAVIEKHRQKGFGSKLIKSLQNYATNTLTNSTVDRIVCACLPEAVDFYRKHCFRKGKKIIPDEEEQEGQILPDGRKETLVALQFAMDWKVPDKKKKGKKVR